MASPAESRSTQERTSRVHFGLNESLLPCIAPVLVRPSSHRLSSCCSRVPSSGIFLCLRDSPCPTQPSSPGPPARWFQGKPPPPPAPRPLRAPRPRQHPRRPLRAAQGRHRRRWRRRHDRRGGRGGRGPWEPRGAAGPDPGDAVAGERPGLVCRPLEEGRLAWEAAAGGWQGGVGARLLRAAPLPAELFASGGLAGGADAPVRRAQRRLGIPSGRRRSGRRCRVGRQFRPAGREGRGAGGPPAFPFPPARACGMNLHQFFASSFDGLGMSWPTGHGVGLAIV